MFRFFVFCFFKNTFLNKLMHKTDGRKKKKENPKQTTTQLICLRQYSTWTRTEVRHVLHVLNRKRRERKNIRDAD